MRNAWLSCADRWLAVADTACRVDHKAAESVDGDITDADPLFAAVGDRPHGFPHRDVLIGDTLDAGEIAGSHCTAILAVEIVGRSHIVEEAIDVLAPFQHVEFAPSICIDA